uniref:EamA family transporter n=1 Tax=Virgisporangium aliadipatigenens TaxID=741659 RepID=UPI00194323A7|nr:EamA family transporter [Virgisporangium aliadipatigenens]
MIVYVVWGSTYLAIRIAVETLPPLLSAGIRFVLASGILAAILAVRGGVRRLRVSVRQFLAAGLVGSLLLAFGNGVVVFAEADPPGGPVPSGVAALLVALVPLLVVVMRAASGDRPGVKTFAGVLVGFGGLAGLVWFSGRTGEVPVVGAFIVLGAATCWATGSFASKYLPLPADPFVATVYESLVGGSVLLLGGVLSGEPLSGWDVSARSWAALAYLVIAGSLVAFTAYVWLLQSAPISLTATYAYVNPVVAVALGALFVAEPITPAIIASGAVIIAGVALVVSTERR